MGIIGRVIKTLIYTGLAVLFILVLFLLIYRWVPLPTSAFIARQDLRHQESPEIYAPAKYQWTDWENISPYVKLAVITAEDQRFPEHYGIDLVEIKKSLKEKDGAPRGASTITQQVAKNLFLWNSRSYLRKGLEAGLALMIELVWSKERILEVYLNIAQFGDAVFGVEMASKGHFLSDAKSLTPEQAVFLAAALPTPALSKAGKPSEAMLKRQAWIRQQMEQLGGLNYLKKLK